MESKKEKNQTWRKRDQTCGFQRWVAGGGRIGGNVVKGYKLPVIG